MSNPDPTPEQQKIRDAFKTGRNAVIVAAAGSGKTTTLRMLAADAGRGSRGLYLAYNRAIADDAAQSFPGGTLCKTAHALAYRTHAVPFKDRLNGPRIPASQAARILQVREAYKIGDRMLQPEQVARLAQEAVQRFCQSADPEVMPWHVPAVPGLESDAERKAVREVVWPYARRAWEDLRTVNGQLKFTHDCYLKLWSLSEPQLPFDFILYDECQPTGTTVLVPAGRANPKRGISTPVAEVPIESLRPGDRVVSYTISGLRLRPTGCVVTDVRSHRHDGRLIIATTGGRQSRYTPDHKCIAVVGGALEDRHAVYLMRRDSSFRVGVTHGLSPTGNAGPRCRLQEERGDEAWVLSLHDTRNEALAAEALASWRYGLPQMRFRGTEVQQPSIDMFWNKVGDLTPAARRCLAEHGRMLEHPLWSRTANSYTLTHRPMVVRACNLLDGMGVIDASRMLARESQRRTGKLDFEPIRVTQEPYDGLVWSLEVEGDHTYVADGLVTHNCQDANPVVLDVVRRQEAQVIAVGDPSQAIYGWRGAVNAMDEFKADARLHLSKSFRFGPAIAAEANKWLDILGAELRVEGFDQVRSVVVDDLALPAAVLCRTNAKAVEQVMSAIAVGRRVALVGGGDAMIRLAEAAIDLQAGHGTRHPELFAFATWAEVQDHAANDHSAADLKVFVSLVDKHGPDTIIATLRRLTRDESRADLVISTAHKAKGREWTSVQVAPDFREPRPAEDGTRGEVAREDAMLAYVTVTRAKVALDRSGLAWVDAYVPGAVAALAS